MVRKRVRTWFLSVAFLCGGLVLGVLRLSSAAPSGTVDWVSQPPTVAKYADVDASAMTTDKTCAPMTIRVARGSQQAFENRCYTSTAAGLIDGENALIRPPSYDMAYPISSSFSGVLMPIPTQGGALWMKGYDGTGVTLGYFKNLYGHMSFDTFYNRFNLTQAPDYTFQYQDGHPMQFTGTLATDTNGRFVVADTIFNGIALISTLDLSVRPIASSFVSGSDYSNATAVTHTGKFAVTAQVRPGDNNGSYFKVIDIRSCTGGFAPTYNGKPAYQCQTTDLLPIIKQAIPDLAGIKNVKFANDHTLTFVAKYSTSATGYRYGRFTVVAAGQSLSLEQYEAVGDSYISGEGAFDYRTGTDTDRNKCHQSTRSYPYLLSEKVSSFASIACSGARMQHIVKAENKDVFQLLGGPPSDSELEAAQNTHMPGYLQQKIFIDNDNPEAITVSVGGNDIGFADVVQKCVNPFQNIKQTITAHGTCYSTYEDRLEEINLINSQFTRLRDVYTALKTGATGDRRVYVIGYPQVLKVGGDCGVNVAMNSDEVVFAHDLIAYLDAVIERAAAEAGVQYVDTQQAFNGHRLCETAASQTAVNGITLAKDPNGAIDLKGSFHPNALGHQLLAAVIAAQTNNLTKPMPTAAIKTNEITSDTTATVLQNVPHANRLLRSIKPYLAAVPKVIQRAASIRFFIDTNEFFTRPGSTYTVALNNSVTLNTVTADSNGNVDVATSIPASVSPGFYTLHVYGNDIFGNPIDIQEVIFVAAAVNDYDGDGVANDSDSCELIAQSGIDADHDGVDDACDPSVSGATSSLPDDIYWHDNSVLSGDLSARWPQANAGP